MVIEILAILVLTFVAIKGLAWLLVLFGAAALGQKAEGDNPMPLGCPTGCLAWIIVPFILGLLAMLMGK